MNYKRQLPQYMVGLLVMALGTVLVKKAEVGVSPASLIPAALANITPLTFGNTSILFNLFCFVLIIPVQRRIDIKTVLIIPVAIIFGYLIDMYMFLLVFDGLSLWLRYFLCLIGIATVALGIVLVTGAGLMLPAPDALIHAASVTYKWPHGRIKVIGDIIFVIAAVLIELIFCRRVISTWIGTILSALLSGRLVHLFGKYLPWLDVKRAKQM